MAEMTWDEFKNCVDAQLRKMGAGYNTPIISIHVDRPDGKSQSKLPRVYGTSKGIVIETDGQ